MVRFAVVLVAAAAGALAYVRRPSAKYGRYAGISLSASQGASFQESRMDFSYDEQGIVLDSPVERYAFKTRFPNDWLFSLKGWGVDRGVSVRQHATSSLAQVIFLFSRDFPGVCVQYGADVVMILGEGMPAPLAVFVRVDRPDVQQRLEKLYASLKGPTPEPYDGLTPVPDVDAKLFASYGSEEKRKLIDDAGRNLWTADPAEMRRRLDILALGMNDPDQSVQVASLREFMLGAQVTLAVPLVIGFLKRNDRDSLAMAEALDAATCLLYEAKKYAQEIGSAAVEGEVVDLGKLYRDTGGLLTPEQHEAVEHLAYRTPERSWTVAQRDALEAAIKETVQRWDEEGIVVPFLTAESLQREQAGS